MEVNYAYHADNEVNSIGGLTNDDYYELVTVDNGNAFQLYADGTTSTAGATPIQFSDPGGSAVQALSFISNTITLNPIPVTSNGTGTEFFDGTTLEAGGVDATTDDLILPEASLVAAGLPNG